ncbi:MAG: hypothetical protein HFE57_03570 [Firmicutes bacterium]|jgi:hypothetical protein|nr:hypothetical protein [Bacillota bacterium]
MFNSSQNNRLNANIDALTIFSVILQVINYMEDSSLTNQDILTNLNNQSQKIIKELQNDFSKINERLEAIEKKLEIIEERERS